MCPRPESIAVHHDLVIVRYIQAPITQVRSVSQLGLSSGGELPPNRNRNSDRKLLIWGTCCYTARLVFGLELRDP